MFDLGKNVFISLKKVQNIIISLNEVIESGRKGNFI